MPKAIVQHSVLTLFEAPILNFSTSNCLFVSFISYIFREQITVPFHSHGQVLLKPRKQPISTPICLVWYFTLRKEIKEQKRFFSK
jgi:hypothetical protein